MVKRRVRTCRVLRRGAAGAAGVLALAIAGCSGGGGQPATPQPTASSFLADWSRQDWAAMRLLTPSPPADFTAVNQAAFASLGVTAASFSTGPMRQAGDTAQQAVTEHLTLGTLGQINIKTTIDLINRGGRWLLRWSPSTITPQLHAGDKLEVRTSWPARAPILGAGGAPLTVQAPVVVVGLEGTRVKNPKSLTAALVAAGATKSQVATGVPGRGGIDATVATVVPEPLTATTRAAGVPASWCSATPSRPVWPITLSASYGLPSWPSSCAVTGPVVPTIPAARPGVTAVRCRTCWNTVPGSG